ncbi:MAG: alkaline phosphatase family protein, partial [Solirubrobacterales bacterium]|nr:alkaline phosphatase family protein [Solirubrobacterales bacterium]
ISVDGLHQSDLDWYVKNNPHSELAKLAGGGAEFSNAHTSVPSDSDPGGTALMTGGDPRATGVYYDVEYNHDLYEAGTKACKGVGAPASTGADVIYDSPDDLDATKLDAGQGLSGLPGSILQMTGQPQTLLNPMTFPVDPKTCLPIYPASYLKVNTMFEVARDAGLRTAWSDKHPVYESFNGPSGTGIDDLFTPEIDSNAIEPNGALYKDYTGTSPISWTGDNGATRQYDNYKVQAILNEIDGYDHSGTGPKVGTPAIFGMNFQTVSTAEKLYKSQDQIGGGGPILNGGYLPGTTTPGPLLSSALDYINSELQLMDQEIQKDGLAGSTAIIITAKHGQSPQDPNQLARIQDGPIISAINEKWCEQQNPTATPDPKTYCTNGLKASTITPLIVAGTDDDLWQSYLSVKTQQAADFVKSYLWNHDAEAVDYAHTGIKCPTYPAPNPPDPGCVIVPHSGLVRIYAGHEAADFFGVPYSDPRYPDVFGRVRVGVVYTGGTKIAEHGGDNPADRDVPLVVYAPGAVNPSTSNDWVETTQVAPTILRLLGLDPDALQAVQIEGTQVLPGIH